MREHFAAHDFSGIGAFRDGISKVCGCFDVRAAEGGTASASPAFRASTALRQSNGLELAYVAVAGASVLRSGQAYRTDHLDHFVLTIQNRGSARMRQLEGDVIMRPGDMFLMDAARPSHFNFEQGFSEQLSVHLPREDLIRRIPALPGGGLAIRREDSIAIAMQAVLNRLCESREEAATPLQEALFALFGSYMHDLARGSADHGVQGEGLFGEALRLIRQNFRDPDFSAGTLCALLGVAPRQLQRAFARHGDSPREQILAIRLDAARRRLMAEPQRTVADIAFEQGFGDLSHFYRAYRRRFGHAPGAASHH
ncbi:helix-turn-helix domain-containing protein [Pannonibacter sp. Pt2]|uniref:Helix-turn-helix domain-containing protein n=1 Tax=Pannonibacter anstelovis TaxID=3121537 RepID=A0ABU7ZKR9_9HYPH